QRPEQRAHVEAARLATHALADQAACLAVEAKLRQHRNVLHAHDEAHGGEALLGLDPPAQVADLVLELAAAAGEAADVNEDAEPDRRVGGEEVAEVVSHPRPPVAASRPRPPGVPCARATRPATQRAAAWPATRRRGSCASSGR